MAKKITDTENPLPEAHNNTTAQPELAREPASETPKQQAHETLPATESPKPQTKEVKKAAPERPSTDIPDYADKILRTFPNYAQLYIDFSGGTFTVDTPPAFRSTATLYHNPYYKP